MMKYRLFETDMGWTGILASDKGVVAIALPRSTPDEARFQLGKRVAKAVPVEDSFGGLVERLRDYFSGRPVSFTERLDFSDVTDFQAMVYRATETVPYGETRTYGWLADRIGKPGAARAVGQALGRNPWPIIVPCHRVLTAGHRLGGFSGGLDTKRRLLRLENYPPPAR